ncbi:hypothetical protein L6C46_13910, partial [Staphylococcus aureus]
TYTHTEITEIEEVEYEDENGNHRIEEFKDYYVYIYKVKCANCGFQLNDKGIKNLKEYKFDVEDYWKNIDHY